MKFYTLARSNREPWPRGAGSGNGDAVQEPFASFTIAWRRGVHDRPIVPDDHIPWRPLMLVDELFSSEVAFEVVEKLSGFVVGHSSYSTDHHRSSHQRTAAGPRVDVGERMVGFEFGGVDVAAVRKPVRVVLNLAAVEMAKRVGGVQARELLLTVHG